MACNTGTLGETRDETVTRLEQLSSVLTAALEPR